MSNGMKGKSTLFFFNEFLKAMGPDSYMVNEESCLMDLRLSRWRKGLGAGKWWSGICSVGDRMGLRVAVQG